MKRLKYLMIPLVLSCDIGLSEDLNKTKGKELIDKHLSTGVLDGALLAESNAQKVIEANGDYLFVVNSFNGDFNGYLYSEKYPENTDTLKFNQFYVLHSENSIGKWTEVYGKW